MTALTIAYTGLGVLALSYIVLVVIAAARLVWEQKRGIK